MAPEMFKEETYTNAVDTYLFAWILYDLSVGESVSWLMISPGTLMNMVLTRVRAELPASMNEMVRDVIQKGSSVDRRMRYSFDQIWSHLTSISFQLTPNVNRSRGFGLFYESE
jgi:hypothetical protein